MELTRQERETIVLLNEADEYAEIEAHNSRLKKRLSELCKLYPNDVHVDRTDKYATVFKFPKSWLRINPPREPNISDEQREKLRERAKTNFKTKNREPVTP